MIVKCIKDIRILDKRIFLKGELYDTKKLPCAIANLPFSINFGIKGNEVLKKP